MRNKLSFLLALRKYSENKSTTAIQSILFLTVFGLIDVNVDILMNHFYLLSFELN